MTRALKVYPRIPPHRDLPLLDWSAAALLMLLASAPPTGVFAADTACHPNVNAAQDRATVLARSDISGLPWPLKQRIADVAARPHSVLPIQAFAEADKPSQLFQYYLLDTTHFQPNVFTAVIPGVNDTAMKTATGANCGAPTIGSVRLVVEPKPGLPTNPQDPRAFIDVFTDIAGLFVINNESGWYEGWMIHDLPKRLAVAKIGTRSYKRSCRSRTSHRGAPAKLLGERLVPDSTYRAEGLEFSSLIGIEFTLRGAGVQSSTYRGMRGRRTNRWSLGGRLVLLDCGRLQQIRSKPIVAVTENVNSGRCLTREMARAVGACDFPRPHRRRGPRSDAW